MDSKIRHLEFIQQMILRMASNSFLLKGWTVTIVVGIFVFANPKEVDSKYLFSVLIPILFFWLLDGFFLHQEKLFRKLYDKVRVTLEADIDFSMNTSLIKKDVDSWSKVTVSKTLSLFYFPLLLVVLLAIYFAYLF